MAELFGFKFERIKDTESQEKFTQKSPDDGTVEVAGGGHFAQVLDQDGRDRNENDLVRRYRDIAQQPECDSAIEDIMNEAIVANERDQSVSIITDNLPHTKRIKDRIREEFDSVLKLLDFDTKGPDIFRRWYVDGRIYYHKVIDTKNPKMGIQEVRYIDPRQIKKVREIKKQPKAIGPDVIKKQEEYYIYNAKGNYTGTGSSNMIGVRLSPDSVTYCPSGLIDANRNMVLSYLHKAIKPVNQLRMIEDSLVIYRISRAPERRIFYIDVGNLPKVKAEQYLKDVMQRYRNKLVYDAKTGEIRDDRNHMSMLEDFWLPRREGGRGTEITTLPGGSNLGEIEDITYFQRKLYRSLNVPISRLEAEQNFSLGRSTEITRDELKFTKFVQKIRKKFTPLFNDMLKTQLVLKGVINVEEWPDMREHISYDFLQDNNFAELKNAELLREKIDQLGAIEGFVGTFFSKKWVQQNVLKFTEFEIEEMKKQINIEAGIPPEEGGVNLPPNDGVTNEPLQGQEQPPQQQPPEDDIGDEQDV